MILVRRYAEFRADFPDDHIWNDDETEVVQTGGKAVAEAIAEILAGFGCIIHELEDNVGHCWECGFSYEGLGLWFHLVDLNPCIFVLQEPPGSGSDSPLYFHILLKLNELLRRDGRFHDLAWYAYDDRRIGKEAFEIPVVGDIPAVDEIKKKRGFLDRLLAPLKVRSEVRQ